MKAGKVERPLWGSISERRTKDGTTRYLAQCKPTQGIRPSETHDTYDDALRYLRDMARRAWVKLPPFSERAGSGEEVWPLLQEWLPQHEVKPQTVEKYALIAHAHIRTHAIAKISVAAVRPMDVDAVLRSVKALSSRVSVGSLLSKFFQWAVSNGKCSTNPYAMSQARAILKNANQRMTRRPSADVAWTRKEFAAFLRVESDVMWRMVWRLFAVTAVRSGTMAGLRWDAVDTAACTALISETGNVVRSRIRDCAPADRYHIGTPKGGTAYPAYFGPVTAHMLDDWRADQAVRAAGEGWVPTYVFHRRQQGRGKPFPLGHHLDPQSIERRVQRHSALAGVRYPGGPHVFRRMWATLGDEHLVRMGVLRDGLAHKGSDARGAATGVTGDYVKSTPDELRAWAARLEGLLFAA